MFQDLAAPLGGMWLEASVGQRDGASRPTDPNKGEWKRREPFISFGWLVSCKISP